MKKITISLMLMLTFLLAIVGFSNVNVYAETGEALFSVEPVLPENQDELIKNYISITTKDAINQTFQFTVRNRTEKEVTLKVRGFDTLTSSYGVLQYKIFNKEEDLMSLTDDKYYLSQYVQDEQEIVLAPSETKIIDVKVDVPVLKGSILGGIAFTAFEEGEVQKEEEVQFKINNEMNTIIGFMVNYDADQKEDLKYDTPWVQSMPSYYGIFLPTTHDVPTLAKQGQLEYEVFNKDGKKLFESKGTTLDFAPKSKTNLLFKWNSSEIKIKEEYRLKGKITIGEDEFPFDFPVVLEDDEYIIPKEMNEKVETKLVDDKGSNLVWYIVGGAVLLLLILALLLGKKSKYVLLSNTQQTASVVAKADASFNSMVKEKDAKNDKANMYHHYYKRQKNKSTKEIEYVFVETKIVNPNNNTNA